MHVVGQESLHQDHSERPDDEVCSAVIPELLDEVPPLAHRLRHAPQDAHHEHQEDYDPDQKQGHTHQRFVLVVGLLHFVDRSFQDHGHEVDERDHGAGDYVVGLLLEVGEGPAPADRSDDGHQDSLHGVLEELVNPQQVPYLGAGEVDEQEGDEPVQFGHAQHDETRVDEYLLVRDRLLVDGPNDGHEQPHEHDQPDGHDDDVAEQYVLVLAEVAAVVDHVDVHGKHARQMLLGVVGFAVVQVQVVYVLVLRVGDAELVGVVAELVDRQGLGLRVQRLLLLTSAGLPKLLVVVVEEQAEHEREFFEIAHAHLSTSAAEYLKSMVMLPLPSPMSNLVRKYVCGMMASECRFTVLLIILLCALHSNSVSVRMGSRVDAITLDILIMIGLYIYVAYVFN